MEKIHQLKAKKKKEKGSQHDPEPVADKEETPVVAHKTWNNVLS